MRSYRKNAYHEAGHAVAHHFFPMAGRTTRITIEPGRLSEYNAGKHEVNRAAGIHFSGKTLSPIVGRSVDREQVRHQLMALLAGPAAGGLYAGYTRKKRKPTKARLKELEQHADGSGDQVRAIGLIHAAGQFDVREAARRIPDEERGRLSLEALMERYGIPAAHAEGDRIRAEKARYDREAFDFVASKWPHIQALADALFRKKTLDGDEVAALIEAIEARLSQGPPPELWRPEP